ncbi:MAG TPA: hypothetical protein VFQ36_05130 [Ktedonobacteraceae bacterium]|nr:hypothetical protein [Ktedonobacteraceae bacterium]
MVGATLAVALALMERRPLRSPWHWDDFRGHPGFNEKATLAVALVIRHPARMPREANCGNRPGH